MSPKVTSSYIQGPSDIPLLDKTVGQCLEETVERFPDREALVFCRDGLRKTFAQFKEEVSACFAPQVSGEMGNSFMAQLRIEMSCVWAFIPVQREQHISSMHQWAVLPSSSSEPWDEREEAACAKSKYPIMNIHTYKLSHLSDGLWTESWCFSLLEQTPPSGLVTLAIRF